MMPLQPGQAQLFGNRKFALHDGVTVCQIAVGWRDPGWLIGLTGGAKPSSARTNVAHNGQRQTRMKLAAETGPDPPLSFCDLSAPWAAVQTPKAPSLPYRTDCMINAQLVLPGPGFVMHLCGHVWDLSTDWALSPPPRRQSPVLLVRHGTCRNADGKERSYG